MNQIGYVVEKLRPWKDERWWYECCTAALLVLCNTALVLRQDSGVRWAGIADNERVKHFKKKKIFFAFLAFLLKNKGGGDWFLPVHSDVVIKVS